MSYNNIDLNFIKKCIISDNYAEEILDKIFQDQLEWQITKVSRFSLKSDVDFKIGGFDFTLSFHKKTITKSFNYDIKLTSNKISTGYGHKDRTILRIKRNESTSSQVISKINSYIKDFNKWDEIKKCIKKELKEKYNVGDFKVYGEYCSNGTFYPYTTKYGKTFGEIKIHFFPTNKPIGLIGRLSYKYTEGGIEDDFKLTNKNPNKIESIDKYIKDLESSKEELESILKMVEWYILNYRREKRLKKILEKQKK